MHVETITICRTFQVTRFQWKGRKWTEFGFDMHGRTVNSAQVYGHPEVRNTMHLTLVLPRKDAWGSICGWFDHADQSIQIEGNGVDWGFLFVFLFGVSLTLLILIGTHDQIITDKTVLLSLVAVAQSAAALFFGVRLLRKIRTARVLRERFSNAKQNAT